MAFPISVRGKVLDLSEGILGRLTTRVVDHAGRSDLIRLDPEMDEDTAGYAAVLAGPGSTSPAASRRTGSPYCELTATDHLEDGDIVAMYPSGLVRTMFKERSQHNALFATEECNSYCLMCSQPPRRDDPDARLNENLRVLALIRRPPETLGVTGGEPTLLGDGFVRLVRACKERMPDTTLHVLSNGRAFRQRPFADAVADVDHPGLMLAVPLYADVEHVHDYVVQVRGAFRETVDGLLNLAERKVRIEIRVVLHRHTIPRLEQLADFIYRNLPFVEHVALMALEPMGFAIANLEDLWVDPFEYGPRLASTTMALANRGMNVSIYNHQLCVVPRQVWTYCRKSISDWKNDYLPECGECALRDQCGGFFSSAIARQRSAFIRRVSAPVAQQSPRRNGCDGW